MVRCFRCEQWNIHLVGILEYFCRKKMENILIIPFSLYKKQEVKYLTYTSDGRRTFPSERARARRAKTSAVAATRRL
jgi:hypothetical protein